MMSSGLIHTTCHDLDCRVLMGLKGRRGRWHTSWSDVHLKGLLPLRENVPMQCHCPLPTALTAGRRLGRVGTWAAAGRCASCMVY